jgi:hypothetical protein
VNQIAGSLGDGSGIVSDCIHTMECTNDPYEMDQKPMVRFCDPHLPEFQGYNDVAFSDVSDAEEIGFNGFGGSVGRACEREENRDTKEQGACESTAS